MGIKDAIPVIPSLDVRSSCAFMTDHLGFELNFVWQEDQDAPPTYGGVHESDIHVHFALTASPGTCKDTICRLYVDDIDAVYKRACVAGIVHPNGALSEKPWGELEFAVLNQDGVCFFIAAEIG